MTSVTIYDVAACAGVSIKTVSRVMNAGPNVSGHARARLAAAEALGYHPNLSARSLAGSKSYLIAVFVDASLTIDHWKAERGAYLARIQLGATLECRKAGYHLLIELIDADDVKVRQEVRSLLAVAQARRGDTDAAELRQRGRAGDAADGEGAVRAAGGGEPAAGRPAPALARQPAAVGMTEHLIGLGHRRIGFVSGDPRYGSSRSRREGLFSAMRAHGLEVVDDWIKTGRLHLPVGAGGGAGADGARRAADGGVRLAATTWRWAAWRPRPRPGVSVPEDLSLAGFDASAAAQFSRPTLTTVRQPLTEMAELCRPGPDQRRGRSQLRRGRRARPARSLRADHGPVDGAAPGWPRR